MNTIDLAALYPVDDDDLTRLHARLAAAAERRRPARRRVSDGRLPGRLAADRRDTGRAGARRVQQRGPRRRPAEPVRPDQPPRAARPGPPRRRRRTQLDEYFAGRRHNFDVPLDWQLSKGFRRVVLEHLAVDIGYGSTASYGTLARLSGSPKAVRAVGTTCATNPIPVVVPCHRVVRSDGTMGGYRGGPAAKRALLDLEGVA